MGGASDEEVCQTDSREHITEGLQNFSGRLRPSGRRRLSDAEEDRLDSTAGDSGRAEPILGAEDYFTGHPFGVVLPSDEEEDRVEATAGDTGHSGPVHAQGDYVAASTRAQQAGHGADGEGYEAFSRSPSPFVGSPGDSKWSTPEPYEKAVDEMQLEMSTAGLSRVQHERMLELTSKDFAPQPASKRNLSPTVEYLSALSHLAVFGMLGVLIRYGLEVLFGPQVAGVTDDHSVLFLDLPANMVGSFFMGWVGVFFKKDLSLFSELLAVGLSTGLMGSITTFASWNQRMLAIATAGNWPRAICGLVIGMQLSWMSLVAGIDSARGLLALIQFFQQRSSKWGIVKLQRPAADNPARRWASFWFFTFVATSMWIAALLLTLVHLSHVFRRRLWLACAVAPLGVWTRWHLARLNGQGVGSKPWIRWLPVGTLLTNVIASWLEAGLSTVQLAAEDKYATWLVGSLQLGLLGCMSTVSTFVVEVHTMQQGEKPWRAYAYIFISISCSFLLGILTYSIPVWALQLTSRHTDFTRA